MVIITKVDGTYFMNIDGGEAVKLEVKQPNGWDPTIFLPKDNPTKRTLINVKVAEKQLAEHPEGFELTVKPDRAAPGSKGPSIPNKKLVEYLKGYKGTEDEPVDGDALYAEYMAIIEEAIAARNDAKAKPMTELEKAQAKAERAAKAYEKLLAEAAKAGDSADEDEDFDDLNDKGGDE